MLFFMPYDDQKKEKKIVIYRTKHFPFVRKTVAIIGNCCIFAAFYNKSSYNSNK